MILSEPSVMLCGKLGGCYRIAVTHTDMLHAREAGDVLAGIACSFVITDDLVVVGTEGSSGSHSPLPVAVWVYSARLVLRGKTASEADGDSTPGCADGQSGPCFYWQDPLRGHSPEIGAGAGVCSQRIDLGQTARYSARRVFQVQCGVDPQQ